MIYSFIGELLTKIFESHFAVRMEMGNLINASTEVCIKRYLPDHSEMESLVDTGLVVESYDFIPVAGRKRESQLLTKDSTLLESSRESVAPIAKFVSRLGSQELKTFSISQETRDIGRGHMIHSRATFSIVFGLSDQIDHVECREAEVILTSITIVKTFTKFLSSEICLEIADTRLLSVIANLLELDDVLDYKSLVKLFASAYNGDEVWNLCRESAKNTATIKRLMEIKAETFENFEKKLTVILGTENSFLNNTLKSMKIVHDLISNQVKDCDGLNVVYSLCSSNYKRISYHAGLTFSLSAYRKSQEPGYNKRTAVTPVELIYGGRFDNLIEGFSPQEGSGRMMGCSLTVKNFELFGFLKDYCDSLNSYPKVDISVHTGVSVLVACNSPDDYVEMFEIASELWSHNIKTDILQGGLAAGSEKNLSGYRKKGINYIVVAKKHDDTQIDRRVSLKNLKSHKGEDYLLKEVINLIKQQHVTFDNFTTRRDRDLIDSML